MIPKRLLALLLLLAAMPSQTRWCKLKLPKIIHLSDGNNANTYLSLDSYLSWLFVDNIRL